MSHKYPNGLKYIILIEIDKYFIGISYRMIFYLTFIFSKVIMLWLYINNFSELSRLIDKSIIHINKCK